MARAIGLAIILLCVSAVAVSDTPQAKLLSDLQLAFQKSRALPVGSRPSPPRSLNINDLVGTQPDAIGAFLGTPDHQGSYLHCDASQCWAFRYGPEREPIPPPKDLGDGWVEMEVDAGGPWLLLIGFDNDSIKTARWRGQR